MTEYFVVGEDQNNVGRQEKMEESHPGLLKQEPICALCGSTLRYLGEKKLIDNMEKGLNASLTLADKSILRLYVCDNCRKVDFYLP